jgi:hypothetical protein
MCSVFAFASLGPRLKSYEPRVQNVILSGHIPSRIHTPFQVWSKIPECKYTECKMQHTSSLRATPLKRGINTKCEMYLYLESMDHD